VVAFLLFFELVQVVVQLLFAEEGGAVDALQLGIFFVAQPVGAGDVQQLEGLDFAGRGKVRPAAEISELAGAVDGNFQIGRASCRERV